MDKDNRREDATILLDRIEAHELDLERRVCVLRPSGDPIELPIDLEFLVGITQFYLNVIPQMEAHEDRLTKAENYGKVNERPNSGLALSDSYLIDQINMWQGALNHNQNSMRAQLEVNREQSRVIANLVTLLSETTNVQHIQRDPESRFDSDDARHSVEGTSAGEAADAAAGS